MIFMASTHMLFTTQCEHASLQGLAGTMRRMTRFITDRANAGAGVAQVLGIVPTMYQSNTIAHQEGLAQLQQGFGSRVWSPVGRRIAWADASNANRTIFAYDPGSDAAADGWQTYDDYDAALEVQHG
jgi:cellulose biosynthesis protein BcsQ